ncbi:MAG: hypothetical protein M1839_002864 [Geoglossum umbratile]|nr:MAG: hypothetical protein M1839_002864 [Geoglossum umbratile]
MESGLLLRASRVLFYRFSRVLLLLFATPTGIQGAPIAIHRRVSQTAGLVNAGPDAWAEALSGVGPLILLVGERSTKQLLRNVRGVHNAFSLAAAPLGLLSVVTSVIRLCGIRRLRAFIGYELEARVAAAVEMTRVNCGGVHAEMVDGYIVRSTSSDPSGQAIAVSKLEGDFDALAAEAVLQIQACDKFKNDKMLARVPDNIAPVYWCLQMTAATPSREIVDSFIETVVNANGIESIDASTHRLQSALADSYSRTGRSKHNTQTEILALRAANSRGSDISEKSVSKAHTGNQDPGPKPSSEQFTFLCTLEAVSEFATSSPIFGAWATLLGIISLSLILALQILALRQKEWHFSAGWILMFVGYIGIVVGVTAGALLIHSSCVCVPLENRSATSKVGWVDGIVVSVKNTDSMDTTGSSFMSSPKRAQVFEVVWKKDLTSRQSTLATAVVILLVASFVCHYLGLRSLTWWVSVGELFICLISAFARSITKDHQEQFSVVDGVQIDKRCTSTGIIHMQKAERVDEMPPNLRGLDFRAYSEHASRLDPQTGEHVAWHAAKLCVKDGRVSSKILELTGMMVAISKEGQEAGGRSVLASFLGGVLVGEGLAFPSSRLGIAFRTPVADLATPTPFLARTIMRQPQWMVAYPELGEGVIPIGNVYIFSISSMMDWWTVSEDRNDMGDLQRNLHWPLLLINIAFYVCLLTLPEGDAELVDAIERAQKVAAHEKETAEAVVEFFRKPLVQKTE